MRRFIESINVSNVLIGVLVSVVVLFAGVVLFQPKTFYSYSGRVTGKSYTPSKNWTTYSTNCKENKCTTTSQSHYEPEHFYLDVFGNDETRTFSVSSERYASSYVRDTIVGVNCWKGKWIGAVFCDLS